MVNLFTNQVEMWLIYSPIRYLIKHLHRKGEREEREENERKRGRESKIEREGGRERERNRGSEFFIYHNKEGKLITDTIGMHMTQYTPYTGHPWREMNMYCIT